MMRGTRLHDTTDGGETTQTLQKLSCPALLDTRAGQLFSAASVPLGFILVLGATYLTAQNMCFPFPCCTTYSPSYRRWLSSIRMIHGQHKSFLNRVRLKFLRASFHLPVMAPCFLSFSTLLPLIHLNTVTRISFALQMPPSIGG